MSYYNSFLKHAKSSLIVGRQDSVKHFETILSRFKSGNFKRNLVIVSGSPGIGKSTLLNLYGDIVKREGMSYIQPTIQMGKLSRNLFREIYRAMSSHLEKEKKGFLQRSKEVQIKSVSSKSATLNVMNDFVHNLQVNPPKVPIIIALDTVDRILDSGQNYIIEGLLDLISTLRGKFQIFFIITIQNYHTSEMKEFIQMGEHIVLDCLSHTESKLLLSNMVRGHIQTSNQLYEDFIKQSDRSPFNVVFISEVINWANDKIRIEGFTENEETIRELAQPFIRNLAIRAFIQETFNISKEEDDIIQIMLDSSKNAVHKHALPSTISRNDLENLLKKGLIIKQGDYYQFSSYTLFTSLGLGTRVVDQPASVELMLSVLEEDIRKNIGLNLTILERLDQICYSKTGLKDPSIPNRAEVLYNSVLDQDDYYGAFNLALLTGNLLRMTKGAENSGKFFETSAQSFYYRGKFDYSTALYRKAIEAFHIADNKNKFKAVSKKIATLYLQHADGHIITNNLEFARSAYYHSIQFFKQAEDYASASETAKKAAQTYEKSIHSGFFKKLIAAVEPYTMAEGMPNE
ncbi:MAG: ATP-binding protein [Candidatus Hodarchaeota archaeon]